MWYHNLLILILYLTLFHIFICTVEWYNHLFGLDDVIGPFSLNSKQLRSLLDVRGIFDAGIVEKSDLMQLADASGTIRISEIKNFLTANVVKKVKSASDSTPSEENESAHLVEEFIGSEHFFEQVEDSKDSLWLIKIVARNSRTEINPSIWSNLIRKFERFGVRFGILYCSIEPELCSERHWNTSRFLMAMPGSRGPSFGKGRMMLLQFTGPFTEHSLTQWVYTSSSQKSNIIKMTNSPNELSHWLLHHCSLFDQVCLLLVSTLTLPPFFLAALSVRFNGRIKIGFCSPSTLDQSSEGQALLAVDSGASVSSENSDSTRPNSAVRSKNVPRNGAVKAERRDLGRYFIASGTQRTLYGNEPEQLLTFQRLQGYMKWLAPDLNDVFVFTLFLTNALALVSIFDLARASPFQRTVHFFFTLLKYNAILLVVWICLSSIANWHLCASICQRLSFFLRQSIITCQPFRRFILMAGVRSFGDHATRSYWSKLHLTAFLAFNCAAFCLRRKFWPNSLSDETTTVWTQWSNFYNSGNLSRQNGNFDQTATTRGFGLSNFWSHRAGFLPSSLHFGNDSADLHPALIRLIEKCGIENVRAYPSVSYDYILRLETIYFRSARFYNKIGKMTGKAECHLCLRCKIASRMRMKRILNRLAERPCSKCKFRPHPKQFERNHSTDASVIKIVDNFPHSSTTSSTNFNCPICLDAYKNGELLCKLPCNHSYHQRCILAWLLRDQPSCPFCRYPAYFVQHDNSFDDKIA